MDQGYPLKSYTTKSPSGINYGDPSPPGPWQQPASPWQQPQISWQQQTPWQQPPGSWQEPPYGLSSTIRRKAHPHGHNQSSSGYEPLTEAYTGYEPFPPQQAPQRVKTSSSTLWWIPEIVASFFAVACLVAIIVLLRYYDRRPLTELNLPGSLTLNGIIAAISTLARVAMMMPVASSLSQECWIWFSSNSQNPQECRSRLKDLDLSDEASRSAWGSLLFLIFARGRWIAYIGALATIISLGFGTATQQLLAIGQFEVDGNTGVAPGNLPRAETWQYYNIRPSEGSQSLPLDLRAAIYNGMLTDKVDPITATCATGNCTWPITPSLAVCGGCSPSTYDRQCGSQYCNYTLPSGVQTQILNGGNYGTGFSVTPTYNGSIYDQRVGDKLYIIHFDAVGTTSHKLGSFPNSSIIATECAMWLCIQSFSTSMVAGKIQQNVTKEFTDLQRPTTQNINWLDNFTFADLPAEMNPSPATTYNVTYIGLSSFGSTLYKLFNGTAFLNQGGALTNNDAVEAIWNASANLDPWIKNVAASLTNALRYDNTNPHPPSHPDLHPAPRRPLYDGKAYVLGVRVQWHWLALPVVCITLSISFLIMVMIETAGSPVTPWKSSLLAFLFFDVDQDLRQQVSGRVHRWRGVLNAAGEYKVVLREERDGKWVFKSVGMA